MLLNIILSLQLIGTIEELQAVHKNRTPTITAPWTGDPVKQQSSVPLYSTTSSPSAPQATTTSPLPTASTTPPPTSTTTSTAVSSHVPVLTLSATVSGTEQNIIQLNKKRCTILLTAVAHIFLCSCIYSDVCSSSLPLSGRCSKQTLRKWVTAKRKEKCSISPQPQSSHRTTGMVAACPTPFSNNQMVCQSIVKQDLAR